MSDKETKVGSDPRLAPLQREVRRSSLRGIGGISPTLFDMSDMWRLNATRGRHFNLVFFWMYPIAAFFVFLPTVFALIEWGLKTEEYKQKHRQKWGSA